MTCHARRRKPTPSIPRNDPGRTRDLEDIRALLRANRGTLDIDELREYFRLFDRESLLDDLLRETR